MKTIRTALTLRNLSAFLLLGVWWTLCPEAIFAQKQNAPLEFPATSEQSAISDSAPNETRRTEPSKDYPKEAGNNPFVRFDQNGERNLFADSQTSKIEQSASKDTKQDERKSDFRFEFSSMKREEKRTRLFAADEFTFGKMNSPFRPSSTNPADESKNQERADDATNGKTENFQWKPAIGQSLLFLGIQHGYAIGFQAKTRRDLKHGAFFRDYVDSVKALHGWDDGGRFFTNYIAHPMQGSLTGFIYVQNNPKERKLEFNESPAYWRSRLKAMAWSAAWSTQFELGPISQASIGNVGLHGKETWGDIVVTPTIGTVLLISEDAIDRYVTRKIERNTNNFYVKIFARMLLSPTRNFSNLLRFKQPWYRD